MRKNTLISLLAIPILAFAGCTNDYSNIPPTNPFKQIGNTYITEMGKITVYTNGNKGVLNGPNLVKVKTPEGNLVEYSGCVKNLKLDDFEMNGNPGKFQERSAEAKQKIIKKWEKILTTIEKHKLIDDLKDLEKIE